MNQTLKNIPVSELRIRRERIATMRENDINSLESLRTKCNNSDPKFISREKDLISRINQLTDALAEFDEILSPM